MQLAICGNPNIASQIKSSSKNYGIDVNYFVRDINSTGSSNEIEFADMISFFEFRKKILAHELDGLIIAATPRLDDLRLLKMYGIPRIGIICLHHPRPIYWLDTDKEFMSYLEINIIDACNLNCKGCTHFAGLFNKDDVYDIVSFKRDIRQLAECVDVMTLRLMGGEPLLKKDVIDYIDITRKYFPQTDIRLATNGLLLPHVPANVLETLRKNDIFVDISAYPPTVKNLDAITGVLRQNQLRFAITPQVTVFNTFLTLSGGHDPKKSQAACGSNGCRFMRNGKIYKCPTDGLSYRYKKVFNIKDFPDSTGIDLFAKNFVSLLSKLDGNIELCSWCNETVKQIPWQPGGEPKMEDWLVNPQIE